MAALNPLILVPATGRDNYAVTQNASGIASPNNDLRTSAVDSVHYVDAQSDVTQTSTQASNRWQQPDTTDAEVWTQVVSTRPQQTLPFLTQLLAQQEPSEEAGNETGQPPSVWVAAQQAYLASRDSTIQYLSPMPLYDLFV